MSITLNPQGSLLLCNSTFFVTAYLGQPIRLPMFQQPQYLLRENWISYPYTVVRREDDASTSEATWKGLKYVETGDISSSKSTMDKMVLKIEESQSEKQDESAQLLSKVLRIPSSNLEKIVTLGETFRNDISFLSISIDNFKDSVSIYTLAANILIDDLTRCHTSMLHYIDDFLSQLQNW